MSGISFDFDEYLKALGLASAKCVELEQSVFMCIGMLNCKHPEDTDYDATACLVGGENLGVLLAKLTKLFRTKVSEKKLLDEFAGIRKKIDLVNARRGVELHSSLTPMDDEIYLTKLKRDMPSKETSLLQKERVSIRRLHALADLAFLVDIRLADFFDKNIDHIHTEYNNRHVTSR